MPFFALLLFVLLPQTAFAKDLREKIGVGFSNQFASTPSISVRYGLPARSPAINIGVEVDIGFDFYSDSSSTSDFNKWFSGVRVLYGFVAEDNMNLYAIAGAGFLFQGTNDARVRVQPALGAEFFLYGVENLGFSAEWGLNFDMGSPNRVTTVSGAPLVGLHYYF